MFQGCVGKLFESLFVVVFGHRDVKLATFVG